jgi:hypothetical protein
MKKSELTQITQIVEHLVAKEVRKQLPNLISEALQNMMGKTVVTEEKHTNRLVKVQKEVEENTMGDTPSDFKASLRELFAGTPVMKNPEQVAQTRELKKYTKDPVLNAILNETTNDLRAKERLVGAAAFQGGYSPGLAIVPEFNPSSAMEANIEDEPSFVRNMPSLLPPMNTPILREGKESDHAPMSMIPHGTSVLDLKHSAPPVIKQALTKNYSAMMKLIDKKKGKI